MWPSRQPPLLAADVQASWQEQMATAVKTPALLPDLVHRQPELVPRFAAYYTELRTLPRRVRRALQRQWRLSLAGVALVLALGQSPLQAATIRVNAKCTLVEAIRAANSDAARGGCRAGQGADTILLPAGSMQTLHSVHNTTYGPTGLPVIRSAITIAGQGSTIVRDSGAPEFRMFAVSNTGELTLSETTVSGGRVSDRDVGGGGVLNVGGILTVKNSTISGNTILGMGGGYSNGGGVANAFGGTVTVTHSTISGNRTNEAGGGGVVNFGILTVTHSTISGNRNDGAGDGGGVNNGGAFNRGTTSITNSTISGNDADSYGGGGVFNRGTVSITNSTISGNSVPYGDGGGGVFNDFSGTLTLAHTLVAGNTAPSGPELANSGAVTAANHNLFGVNGHAGVEGFPPGPTDVVPAAGVQLRDILRRKLADNGGPTRTHALVAGSPALDAIPPTDPSCTGTDQRGVPRPQGAGCDIGAFERRVR